MYKGRNNTTKDIELETKVIRLNNNREHFNDRDLKFIESLTDFFYSKNFLSEKQQKYIDQFIKQLDNMQKSQEEALDQVEPLPQH